MTTTSPAKKPGGARIAVQRFGTFLSGMIMPNIAAFIAWGFITMLFIPAGFFGANRRKAEQTHKKNGDAAHRMNLLWI